MQVARRQLQPTPPFDFDLTAGSHTYFRGTYGADLLEEGVYRRLLGVEGRLLLATVHSTGTVESPSLELEIQGLEVTPSLADAVASIISRNLGLDISPMGFYAAAQQDDVLKSLVGPLYGLHPTRAISIFEALVLAVTAQQIASTVARIIRTLLIEAYGPELIVHGRTYRGFPTPQSLLSAGIEGLRSMKLSQRKAEYLLGIAEAACNGSLDLEALRGATDQQLVEEVIRLRGVGLWTAQWLLIRALARPDAFPSGDLAVKRLVSQVYMGGRSITDKQAEEFANRWSPYRTYAVVYLMTAARRGLLPSP